MSKSVFYSGPSGTRAAAEGWIDYRASYKAMIMADSPLGYWRLGEANGNAADSSGNGLTGTPTATITYNVTGAIPPDPNTACTFDGTTGSFSIGNGASVQLTTLTISVWFKTANPGASFRGIVGKNNAYALTFNGTSLGTYDFGGGGGFRSSGQTPTDNLWHHAGLLFKSGVANGTTLYLDGKLVLTTTCTVLDQTGSLLIGTNGQGTQNYAGSIDEVALYNKILPVNQIIHHASGSPAAGGYPRNQ